MKYAILLFTILTSFNIYCQPQYDCDCYDRLVNLSSYYKSIGDYQEAIKVLEKGLEFKGKENWSDYEYFRMGHLWALEKDYNKASIYLGEALRMGYDIESLDYEEFDGLKENPFWMEKIVHLDSLKRDYQKSINLEYRLALEDIRGSDQTIRRLIKVPDSTFAKLDSINFTRVKELLGIYGYPNTKKHGFEGGVYLVLLHASMYSEKDYEEILGILNSAILELSFKKSNLAQFIDRREVWYHKKNQIYGLWNSYRAPEFKDFRDLNGIDKIRFEYNLLRLQEQSIIEGRVLPEGYTKGKYPKNYFCGHQVND